MWFVDKSGKGGGEMGREFIALHSTLVFSTKFHPKGVSVFFTKNFKKVKWFRLNFLLKEYHLEVKIWVLNYFEFFK